MDAHNHAVSAISAKVRHFHKTGEKYRIYHGSTNSTRSPNFERNRLVDTSSLTHVLGVNIAKKTAIIEPNLAMDKLVEATLQHGMLPPVVMEFPGITVGGGFSGTSAESSSFKHGLFEQTIRSIEIVLANGDVLHASREENEDLLHGAAGAFGTLGVVTLLEIDLIEARNYVELKYLPVTSIADAIQTMESSMQDTTNDYIDGIMFSEDSGLIIVGHLTDDASCNIQQFTRARDPLFYLHALDILASPTLPKTETVPIVDYLFRYDRGAFWGAQFAFAYFYTPFNRFTRWLLDPFLHTRVMYHALHKSGLAEQYIVQDCVFPVSTAPHFIEYCNTELGFHPLWLCPLNRHRPISPHGLHPHLFDMTTESQSSRNDSDDSGNTSPPAHWLLNVGVWGPGPPNHAAFVRVNREIEARVRDLGGVKTLYAHTYYTEEEFDTIYDRPRYDALRKKYHATGLSSVYEKVKVDVEARKRVVSGIKSIRPLGGLYGVLRATMGGDYLLARDRPKLWMVAAIVALLALLAAVMAKP